MNQNNRNGAIPEAGNLYVGTVTSLSERFGLTIKLNGFPKEYEGNLHAKEIIGNLTKLKVGNLIRIKLVAISDDFISMTAKDIEQPQQLINLNDGRTVVQKRRYPIASPERKEMLQFDYSFQNVNIEVINEDPEFLKSMSENDIPLRIPKKINIFKNESSSMATFAKLKMKSTSNPSFAFDGYDFDGKWDKSTKQIDALNLSELSSVLLSNQAPIDYQKRYKMNIKEQRESLPIFQFRDEIIKAVTENKVLIIIAETGSGKTTQIPQYLIEGGYIAVGKIACTQPRRFAASSVAERVAEEYGCALGDDVGYKIRFVDFTSDKTIIKYMTDGILLRECMVNPNLDQYSVVILDEAHERTIHTDILFGLMKQVIKRRKNLRLIISSATLDAAKFSTFFDDAKVLHIPGSMYPVETFYYRIDTDDYFNLALNTVLNIHKREPDGDILVFLTGQDEIEDACDILQNYVDINSAQFSLKLIILPMFSALPLDMQCDVICPAPRGCRKVIIATNIAETSVTIDGVKFVVDPGYAKQKIHDPKTGIDNLTIIPISQASADQRMGRAGRTSPGKCYRLYNETSYDREMLKATIPEIQRSDLSSVILNLKVIGIKDILNFDFMDPPQKDNILKSLKQLYLLDALDEKGEITNLGRKMAELPVDPNLAKMLIVSSNLKCTDEIITIVAMLSIGNAFYRPKKMRAVADEVKKSFDHQLGDHFSLLKIYNDWEMNASDLWTKAHFLNEKKLKEAQELRDHLLNIMIKYKYEVFSAGLNNESIQKTICSGFFQNIAKKKPTRSFLSKSNQNNTYVTMDGQECFLHKSRSLYKSLPSWIVYNTLQESKNNGKFLNDVTIIDPKWLEDLVPRMFKTKSIYP